MPETKSFHMTPDEFRAQGHAVIDWIADYYRRIESFPVLAQVLPGEIRASLPQHAPEKGEPFETILRDLEKDILPGITHWQSPNFYAFFPCNASGPGILGDLLSSGLGVQGMLWATSPACGNGTLCAVLAARERATEFNSNRRGCREELVTYTSAQAHSSVEKAMLIAGIGRENLRLIEVDDQFAMRPEALGRAIEQDLQSGKLPCFVCATVGTTSSNAIDPVNRVGQICREYGIWLHVDAAMSGTAALCPEFRYIHDGLEYADSYCFNPHKWMFTNFDCDCFYVADRAALIQTLSVLPEYLRNRATESGSVIDYRDWQIPLGRRFRALKLWFVLRHYGIEGLQFHIREHVRLAQEFAGWVSKDDRFELAVPAPLNLVCFRLKAGDGATQRLMEALNRSGNLYLTHTRLKDHLTLRFCVGQTNTTERHVQNAWRRIQEEASRAQV